MIESREYAARRERLGELLEREGLDAIFVPPSSDLEYLTGIERDLPSFGNLSYAHGWVAGAFLAPGREPVYVLPRMVVAFHLDGVAPERSIVVPEDGDGRSAFAQAIGELGSPRRIALGQRTWAETAVELLAVVPDAQLSEGSSLVNELRRVKSESELALMAQACAIARATMAAVEPQVVAGVSMSDLVEQVEHELRARGSRCPSFPTHIFTWGKRFGGELWRELRQLIEVRRVDSAEPPLVPPQQAWFLRENLKLRLLNARVSLLTRDEAGYREDLRTAQNWIQRYFDVRAKGSLAALAQLRQLSSASVSFEPPSIADSLEAVRGFKARGERKR